MTAWCARSSCSARRSSRASTETLSKTLAYRARWLALAALVAIAAPAAAQRLLLGSWQATLGRTIATLTIITADSDGWVHGMLRYDPPQDGFAGSPFTTHIDNGAFTIRLVNGTRYADMHWCRDALCGVFHAPDDTATSVAFSRPPN
jgi:hypothetical protein